jgi:hypothetical protein
MAVPQPAYTYPDEAAESRRFQRVPVSLSGRYMLESQREFPCRTEQMSPGDMVLVAPAKARLGEKVIVYLDEIGRLAGVAVRTTDSGFALLLDLSPMKRDKLADQLTWFANRDTLSLLEDRRHDRIVPIMRRTLIRLPDGQEVIVKIRDLSLSGVGLETDAPPAEGVQILVGSTPAVVVRHFAGGFGAQFAKPFGPGEIDESTRL